MGNIVSRVVLVAILLSFNVGALQQVSLAIDSEGNGLFTTCPVLSKISADINKVIGMPDGWEILIQSESIRSVLLDGDAKARALCDRTRGEIHLSSADNFQCEISPCSAVNCPSLDTCPPSSCPNFHCKWESECKSSNPFAMHGTSVYPKDVVKCRREAMECREHHADICDRNQRAHHACKSEREAHCAQQMASKAECERHKESACVAKRAAHEECKRAVHIKRHELYERCVEKLGFPVL